MIVLDMCFAKNIFLNTRLGIGVPLETNTIHNCRCGKVTDVDITNEGYAFVTMDDAGARAAIKKLNGTFIEGQEIMVDKELKRM